LQEAGYPTTKLKVRKEIRNDIRLILEILVLSCSLDTACVAGQNDPYVEEVRDFLGNRTLFESVVGISTKEKVLLINKEAKFEQRCRAL
jgi:hypothetical protein